MPTEHNPSTMEGMLALMEERYGRSSPTERVGQAYFNALEKYHPNYANKIRGTDDDPFYQDARDNVRVVRFLAKVKKLLEEEFG